MSLGVGDDVEYSEGYVAKYVVTYEDLVWHDCSLNSCVADGAFSAGA